MGGQANVSDTGKNDKKIARQTVIILIVVAVLLAAKFYGRQKDLVRIDALSAQLSSDSVEMRASAVEELGEMEESEAKAALLTALKDSSS
ncbi:MAG: hypothetical protein GXX89_10610 [Clostridiales bacterium]|jgi:HEAT repeat protein|nr:hypothetical protein [Clostridiales bacterium]